ncbi:bolA-like protein 2 [Saccoglossus kowalevskii]|uniref:BolA-like protein 2-like n=1 Tax=Saccoglossus kowalevskii TaxID=10224 RepID=A0ABM0MNS4_SACKO|nr:PREDICTED: bolA-like protein 2-like [Saccoglossus kowalevskii]
MAQYPSVEYLQEKLREGLSAEYVKILDISDSGCIGGKYKALIVAKKFEGKTLVQRHRLVNSCLEEELKGPIHAFSMKTFTPEQWEDRQISS